MKTLVIGGMGPTGGHVVRRLIERGDEVIILHRGAHEDPAFADLRHIHVDPHFGEPLREALGDERFDLVVAMYGRLEAIGRVVAGRCDRLLAVTALAAYDGFTDPSTTTPRGGRLNVRESDPQVDPAKVADPRAAQFLRRFEESEQSIIDGHVRGDFVASVFRYPYVYGPRSPNPWDWGIVKRILDGRRMVLLPSGGLNVLSRCGGANAANFMMLALDSPKSEGEIFNCADDDVYSLAQWVELIAVLMSVELDVVALPPQLAWASSYPMHYLNSMTPHLLLSTDKARHLLGYRDAVSARDALAEVVSSQIANQPTDWPFGGLAGKFDYAAEDAIISRLGSCYESIGSGPEEEIVHPYPHPKEPSTAGVDHRGR